MNTKTLLASLLLVISALDLPAEEALLIKRTQITVNVVGSVNSPSRVTLTAGATIVDALSSAGSATKDGNLSKVKLIHKTSSEKPETRIVDVKAIFNGAAADVRLRDGDTINVPKVLYVF